jgi:hypothetical protein
MAHNNVDFTAHEIRLSNVCMGAELCGELCDALHENESVGALDLSHNVIGDDGAEHVARLLAANKGVVSLNLSHNRISDAGAIVIARAARRHATLQSLNLAGNPVSDPGLAEISRLLTVTTQLRELVLIDTAITIRGALDLANSMVNNFSLTFCTLPFCLGFSVLEEVQRIMLRNYAKLSRLDEQVRVAAAAATVLVQKQRHRDEQWKVTQPRTEPRDSRLSTVNAPLRDWQDAVQRPTLMYLNLLDRRSQEVEREDRRVQKMQSTPRGRGIGGLAPLSTTTVVVREASCQRGLLTPRSSASGTSVTASTPRFVSLPPLPDVQQSFTTSFQAGGSSFRQLPNR